MSVGPWDLCCVLVMIFAEQKSEDRLNESGVKFDGKVNKSEMRVLLNDTIC